MLNTEKGSFVLPNFPWPNLFLPLVSAKLSHQNKRLHAAAATVTPQTFHLGFRAEKLPASIVATFYHKNNKETQNDTQGKNKQATHDPEKQALDFL
jgi:hypothetical protein